MLGSDFCAALCNYPGKKKAIIKCPVFIALHFSCISVSLSDEEKRWRPYFRRHPPQHSFRWIQKRLCKWPLEDGHPGGKRKHGRKSLTLTVPLLFKSISEEEQNLSVLNRHVLNVKKQEKTF